jgi:hypothetical protein
VFLLAGSLLLLPVTSHYAISVSTQEIKDSISTYFNFNEDGLKKIIPATIIAFGILSGLYYWWTKKNKSEIGYIESFYIQDDIKLTQFQVFCQFNFDGGGLASCGYHALLRGMQIVQAKSNNKDDENLQKTLNDSDVVQYYFGKKGFFFGKNGEWREAIMQKRQNNRDYGDWIDKEEIQYLWENNKNKFISQEELCDFDVVEDVNLIGNPDVDLTTAFILKKIKEILNTHKMYFVIFILSTMEQPKEGEELTMRYGHWYPLVMYQNEEGKRQYYIADSGSWDKTNRLEDPNAWKIINLIEQ